MSRSKKVWVTVIAVLIVLIAGLGYANRNAQKEVGPGLIINADGKETVVPFDRIELTSFAGDLVNGKGETTHHDYEGIELSVLISEQKADMTEESRITVTSEDNYSAELTGAEILENGKVYLALSQDGKRIDGIEGSQGAQLIVFGDSNSKRAVRYMKYIEIK